MQPPPLPPEPPSSCFLQPWRFRALQQQQHNQKRQQQPVISQVDANPQMDAKRPPAPAPISKEQQKKLQQLQLEEKQQQEKRPLDAAHPLPDGFKPPRKRVCCHAMPVSCTS